MPFAHRTSHLKPEGAYQVLARANQLEAAGQEIIHLEIGQPDYPTFENVSEAGVAAIRSGKTRYTPPAGMPTLREALVEDAGRRRGIQVHPDEVVVSPGACARMIDFDPEILSEHKAQLQAYGIIPGYTLRLQQQKPVTVIQVDHTELAFEYDLAKEIFVEEIAAS